MGTHPIFESDFDCLTGSDFYRMLTRQVQTSARLLSISSASQKGYGNTNIEAFKKKSVSEQMNTKERADYARATSRVRVLTLYKAFYRALPTVASVNKSSIPVSDLRALMKNEFAKNSSITDTRAIELLVGKGQIQLQEFVAGFAQESHFHRGFDDLLLNDHPEQDLVDKFIAGKF